MKKLNKNEINKINKILEKSGVILLATDIGIVQIGNKSELKSLYTMTIQELRKHCNFEESDFKRCYDLSKMTINDLGDELYKQSIKMANELHRLFEKHEKI